jgi:hypothetical protein
VLAVQQVLLDAPLDGGAPEAGLQQLAESHNPMLAAGDPGHFVLR